MKIAAKNFNYKFKTNVKIKKKITKFLKNKKKI